MNFERWTMELSAVSMAAPLCWRLRDSISFTIYSSAAVSYTTLAIISIIYIVSIISSINIKNHFIIFYSVCN